MLYGLRKAMHMLLDCNPNVIELLGLRPEHILFCSPEGQLILNNADAFLSQKVIFTFGAYAVKRRREIQKKIDAEKPDPAQIAKEMMHTIRIYSMGIDLLLEGRVTAYREEEHSLLMHIRAGEYQDRHGMPTREYERLLEECMGSFNSAAMRTRLPLEPDRERVNQLTMEIIYRSL